MFERFTVRAREVVVLAQDEARALGDGWVGTEHLLLGLLREGEGIAARVLGSFGIDLEVGRARVRDLSGPGGGGVISGRIPFTARAKKVLEVSLREALAFGHDYIGTEHILLGLARDGEGVAGRLLKESGADRETIRREIAKLLAG